MKSRESQPSGQESSKSSGFLHRRTFRQESTLQGDQTDVFVRKGSRVSPYFTLMATLPLAASALAMTRIPRSQERRTGAAERSRSSVEERQGSRIARETENRLLQESADESQAGAREGRRDARAQERTSQNQIRDLRQETRLDPREKAEAFRREKAGTSRTKQGQRRH